MKFTKMTILRMRRGNTLADVLESNIEIIEEDLESRVTPEYAAMLTTAQGQTAAELRHQLGLVRNVEQELTAEMQDDDPVREERDEAVDNLRELTVQTRPSLEATFGQEQLSVYGLEGETPRTPVELSEFVGNAIHLMRTKPAEQTNPLGLTVSTTAVADVLQPSLDHLDAHLAAVEAERQELITAYNKRDRALTVFDDVYQLAADLADRVYRLAGRDDLADQLATRLRNVGAPSPDADPAVEPTEDEEPIEA